MSLPNLLTLPGLFCFLPKNLQLGLRLEFVLLVFYCVYRIDISECISFTSTESSLNSEDGLFLIIDFLLKNIVQILMISPSLFRFLHLGLSLDFFY